MASLPAPSSGDDAASLVGGLYSVDFSRPLTGVAPPLTVYAATRGGQPGHMAVAVSRGSPARPRPLGVLAAAACPAMLLPVAHGKLRAPSGDTGYFVICPIPPGPSLGASLRPWPEAELLEHLLKPAVQALALLQARNLTHRGIRLDNVFQAGPRTPVALGCAWAAPPACHQPAWMEPPSSAACLPSGRGDGSIADDVYALGVLMVALTLGVDPVAGIPEEELLRRKLDLGSFAAIVGSHRLPAGVADLVRGMLADEAEHRPSPALLANPAAARARRIAGRPVRRAQRPLTLGMRQAWTARTLAHAMQAEPTDGVAQLRAGAVGQWVRRGLGDSGAAGRIDAIVQLRDAEAAAGNDAADPLLLTRAIATLDPAAPLVWRSVSLWLNGLGPALDHALRHAPEQVAPLTEIVVARVPIAWAERREASADDAGSHVRDVDMRNWSLAAKGPEGPLRLSYSLNPLAPCASPTTAREWVIRLTDLLPALEVDCARPLQPGQRMVDADITAFIEARRDERLDTDVNRLAAAIKPDDPLSEARLLARLQAKLSSASLPNLSLRSAELLRPLLDRYHSRTRREQMAARMAAMAQLGQLPPLVALMDDARERVSDELGFAGYQDRIAAVDAMLSAPAKDRPARARRVSHEIVEGIGLLACAVAIGLAVLA